MSGGRAPMLLIRLPSTTMTSLRPAGLPDPSIRVPLRISKVFLPLGFAVALMMSSRFSCLSWLVRAGRAGPADPARLSIDLQPGTLNDFTPLQHFRADLARERLGTVA